MAARPLRVLHLAGAINRYDFIDMVVRFADPARFCMMACTFQAGAIQPPNYPSETIAHFTLPVRDRTRYTDATLRLAALLRRERVDILHTHHYYEALVGSVAARLAGTPAVIIGRHYDDEIYLTTRGFKTSFFVALEQFANRRAKAIIVPAAAIRELLAERQHVPADKLFVIPYGFDFQAEQYQLPSADEREAIRRELGLDGAFVVGNIARQNPLKGQAYLLKAFARFVQNDPNARLLMVGDGPSHQALRALTRELGLADGKVIFTGWRTDARRLVAAMDVVVHPTLLDSFPQVIVEAMALERPVISTPAAGPRDQIVDGATGLLVPMRDSDALLRALCQIWQHRDLAEKIGQAARADVLSRFDIRQVVRDYQAVYSQIAGQAR